MSDSISLVDTLRGKYTARCRCHAHNSWECGCSNTLWPEDVAGQAADLIEQQQDLIAALENEVKLVRGYNTELYERIDNLEVKLRIQEEHNRLEKTV